MAEASQPGALRSVLASHNFRRLYSTRLAGQFGDGLLQSALATFVLFSPERQPDAVSVAAAFAILLLPYSFVGPFAGVLLDRWRRRNVLVRANLLKALLTIPVIVVVGAREAENRSVALRRLGGKDQEILALEEAVGRLTEEAKSPADR